MHIGTVRVNNQLDALFFNVFISLLYMFRANPVLIIRSINCINTSSGICHSVCVAFWYAGHRRTALKKHGKLVINTTGN